MIELKICDIVKFNRESYSNKDNFLYVNYLDTGNITMNKVDEIQFIDLKEEKLPSRARRKVKVNNIIYSTVRPNQCHYGIIKEIPDNFLVSTGFAVMEVDEKKVDPDYLYYWLTMTERTEKLHAIAEQSVSTYPSIKPSDIGDLEIELPDLSTQRKIKNILSSIDSKIVVNNRINDNLYVQAESIYKEFFSSTETATNMKTLDMFCNIFTGKKNSNANDINGQYKFFTCSPNALLINSYIYDGNAIIVSGNGAYTGRTRFYSGKFDLYQRTYACTIKDGINPDYIFPLYWFVKLELSKKIMGGTRGSAIPYIVMNDLAKFSFIKNESFEKYIETFKSLTMLIQENENQNEYLTNLRDSLLPKLMSGEINVEDINLDI